MNNTTATALPIRCEWQSIDTAPLDRIVLLYRPTATKLAIQVAPGMYEANKYAKNPQPYWAVWLCIWNGVTESRAYPPTHWRDYPSPPLPTLELSQGSAAPAPAQPKPAELTEQELWQIWEGPYTTIPDILRAAIAADRARRPTPHTPADAEVRE
jgi:hypothetical protein